MNKQEKQELINQLTEKFNNASFFYFADDSTLNVAKISKLRRLCFEKNIEYKVAKNTLIKKALTASNKNADNLFVSLVGPTAVMFSDNSNTPAKLLKEFRSGNEKPSLKSAYIDSDIFIGDNQLEVLCNLKSKAELIGDIVGLLQSPMKNVVGALQSNAGSKVASLLKAIEAKNN